MRTWSWRSFLADIHPYFFLTFHHARCEPIDALDGMPVIPQLWTESSFECRGHRIANDEAMVRLSRLKSSVSDWAQCEFNYCLVLALIAERRQNLLDEIETRLSMKQLLNREPLRLCTEIIAERRRRQSYRWRDSPRGKGSVNVQFVTRARSQLIEKRLAL